MDYLDQRKSVIGCGGGLVDTAADSGPSSIPLGVKKENKRKEVGVVPDLKKVLLCQFLSYFENKSKDQILT